MGVSRFVRPESKQLPLSNGDWLLVRKRLTTGEQRAAFTRMYVAGLDGEFHVHPQQTGLAKVAAYLIDWSLTNDAGEQVLIRDQPVEVVDDILNALDPEDFAEIRAAIDIHEAAMVKEREAQKKTRAGATTSAPTSPSPDVLVGASTG